MEKRNYTLKKENREGYLRKKEEKKFFQHFLKGIYENFYFDK
jgi:hypothetical protein